MEKFLVDSDHLRIWALPELQNFDSTPNGIGKSGEELEQYADAILQLDVSQVCEGWNEKETGKWSEERGARMRRMP